MLVRDVMSSRVISVEPGTPVLQAARVMLANRISGLPVVRPDGTLVGLVSEGDFLRRAELGTERKRPRWLELLASSGRLADDYVRTHARKVEEVMSHDVVTIAPSAPLDEAIALMGRRRIKRLPVVRRGKVVGFLTRADILRALAKALPSGDAPATGDEAIRAAIEREFAAQPWSGVGRIHAEVTKGAVELSGMILDDRERLAARVVAENVPGVTSVTDRLVFIEPMSGIVVLPPDDESAVSPPARKAAGQSGKR